MSEGCPHLSALPPFEGERFQRCQQCGTFVGPSGVGGGSWVEIDTSTYGTVTPWKNGIKQPSAPSGAGTIRERLEQLALEYHKSLDGEGEYGCNGLTCPGVQKLIRFAERVVAATTPPAPPLPR